MQVANKADAIKIACDFISVQNIHVTHRLVSEFREHRLAVGKGDDVLSLYDTLYRAYVSFPMLRTLAIAPLTVKSDDSQDDDIVCTSGSALLSQPIDETATSDNSAMAVNETAISDNSAMAVDKITISDNSAIAVDDPRSLRKLHKMMLGRENAKNKRRLLLLAQRQLERQTPKKGFDFICPLCSETSYFNRNGLLGHL